MKISFLLAPLFAALLATGCASTRVTSQDPEAEIFLDDKPLGVGQATVRRVGPPRQVTLEARRGGKVVGQSEMRRSFTGMTLVWGLFSYYTGLYWGWYFPESVIIPVPQSAAGAAEFVSPWADPRNSVWMKPLQ
ncbi:MAG: hypothetical protein K0Q91_13 [Fibrobacteria bacterium]|jgi:hypothetical protein|nr:hypothetical protein [Fibrobacteria bacterium]